MKFFSKNFNLKDYKSPFFALECGCGEGGRL